MLTTNPQHIDSWRGLAAAAVKVAGPLGTGITLPATPNAASEVLM